MSLINVYDLLNSLILADNPLAQIDIDPPSEPTGRADIIQFYGMPRLETEKNIESALKLR